MNDPASGIKINYESLFKSHGIAGDDENSASHPGAELHDIYSGKQVDEIIRQEREKLQKKYREEAARIREVAYTNGKKTGRKEAREDITDSVMILQEAINQAETNIYELLHQVKPHVASMVFDLTEKILEIPVENEQVKERVIKQIDKILDQFSSRVAITIEVSLHDFEVVQELTKNRKSDYITLKQDDDLNPGEFRIDTNQEQIVQNFKKSLASFRESFSFEPAEKTKYGK